ncbi:hypothetical protein BgAZ_107350 [Babesia gibsoni]|uniref:Uncharacterized protein n=1 Tax=Babesia gibsoni TaxID=33632 RepID=A0AAD8PGB0_BABGI|nr:hypothetical protein BgAZ_107350 [Babesia gibsoni]
MANAVHCTEAKESDVAVESNTRATDRDAGARESSTHQRHNGNKRDVSSAEANYDDRPPAGLPSERCSRDFTSSYYRKLHSGIKRSPTLSYSMTFEEKPTKQTAYELINGLPSPVLDYDHPSAVKSTDRKTLLQRKLSEQYKRYNHVSDQRADEGGRNHHHNAAVTEFHANRMRNMSHSPIFHDYDHEEKPSRDRNKPTEKHQQPNCDSPTADGNTSNDDSGRNADKVSTEETIIGGTRVVNTKDPDWQIVSFRMSGIKSSFAEKDMDSIARNADMQIVSLNLDRNIYTHACNGTGVVKLRHTNGEKGLLKLSKDCAKDGIKLLLIDIISRSDVIKNRK